MLPLLTTVTATGYKDYFSAFLFILVWSRKKIWRVFYFTW